MSQPGLWTVFITVIAFVLALDLGVLNRQARPVTLRAAIGWSLAWATLALLFAAGVFIYRGRSSGMMFLTGYVIELSLSADNVFLFALLFTYFQVPARYQHRVLTWGVLSAVAMRGLMIAMGATLIHRFEWIITIFGVFLIGTGIRMYLQRNAEPDPEKSLFLQWLRRTLPLTERYHGHKFFVRVGGKRLATPLFLVLVMIEVTDLIFALDSIPAIFAISRDPFIVFTSNIFAIMGLRSLYFLLSGAIGMFHYLSTGLAVVLVFVGAKMVMAPVGLHIPTGASLLFILFILFIAIATSLLKASRERRTTVV